MHHRHGLEITKETWPTNPPHPPFKPRTTLTLYRFFQEALNNVHKHANTHQVTTSLRFTRRHIHAQVTDRGTGFLPTTTPKPGHHIGLLTLTNRAKSSGGKLKIISTPQTGTTLTLTLPR